MAQIPNLYWRNRSSIGNASDSFRDRVFFVFFYYICFLFYYSLKSATGEEFLTPQCRSFIKCIRFLYFYQFYSLLLECKLKKICAPPTWLYTVGSLWYSLNNNFLCTQQLKVHKKLRVFMLYSTQKLNNNINNKACFK